MSWLMDFSTPSRHLACGPHRPPTAALRCGKNFGGYRAFDRFTAAEAAFVRARDSFYMATVSESGWPYMSSTAADLSAS